VPATSAAALFRDIKAQKENCSPAYTADGIDEYR
jgi:hypothetical protein